MHADSQVFVQLQPTLLKASVTTLVAGVTREWLAFSSPRRKPWLTQQLHCTSVARPLTSLIAHNLHGAL